jgi:hypothetical protein
MEQKENIGLVSHVVKFGGWIVTEASETAALVLRDGAFQALLRMRAGSPPIHETLMLRSERSSRLEARGFLHAHASNHR